MQYIQEGLDPTALSCISKSDMLQMIRASKPYATNKIGFIIWAEDAPDVVATPELAYFFWGKLTSGTPTGDIYYYNDTSWSLWTLLDGSKLNNASVTLAKLSSTGASNLDIIQWDGSAFVFTSVLNAITNGTITLAKLVNGGGAGNFVLMSIAGVNQFYTPTQLAALLPAANITITQLANGGAGNNYLLMSLNGVNTWVLGANIIDYITNNTLGLTKLARIGGAALQSIRINAAANAWEFYTPNYYPPLGFEPVYITSVSIVTNVTVTVPWTTVNLATLYPAGPSSYRYAIIRLYGIATEDPEPSPNVNFRKSVSDVTVNVYSAFSNPEDASGQNGSSDIIFFPLTASKTFDYEITKQFGGGLNISLVGYVI